MRLVACLCLSLVLFSIPAEAAIVWSTPRNVINIYPENTGLTFFVDGETIGGTCSGTTNTRMQILTSDSNYDAKVSAVMLAFSGQYRIYVAYDDTTLGSCSVRVNRVQVIRG